MLPAVGRFGGWIMAVNENSSFALDWKLAVVGGLMIIGLVTTTVVAALEGLPWVTRDQMTQRDAVYQGKIDTLTSTQTANANQLAATNAQLSALGLQVAGVTQREADDRLMIDELRQRKQVNSLKREFQRKQYADKLDRQSYERQMKAMEKTFVPADNIDP